jgi:transcriptional regulator with XRE-family HTH domain
MDAELAQQTYGQALGALILQKRRAVGLTQTQLAEEAYLSAAKTRRISELESGKVANPHAATIDPIIVALKITDEELEACAKQAASKPTSDLDEAYRAARNLIEAAARQFEHAPNRVSAAPKQTFAP